MSDRPKIKEWQCPPQVSDEIRRLNWLKEQMEEGQAWLRSQRGYGDWKKAMDTLAGRPDAQLISTYRSQLTTGRLKRNTKEVIGACANIRPIWAYSSDNPAFGPQKNMMNKTTRAIYLEQFLDLGIKQTLQWSAATCTGWLRPCYRRDMAGTGKGNLTFLSYGAPSVLPAQLPSNNNWQEAYAVTLLDELPVYMAHGMFPDYQEQLKPTKSMFWYSSDIRKAAKGNLFQRMWSSWGRGAGKHLSDLYVPVAYTYVIDLAINTTGNMIPMGQYGTSWYYEVPSVGEHIKTGIDRKTGQITYREATENDARLYPYRRLIISSDEVIMYDGPAFDWHGELPLIPFCLDDWAWEAIGFSIMRDGYQVQQAINEIDRGTMDKVRAGLDMALAYDINSVTRNEANTFDPMQPRARVGFDGSLVDQPFKQVVPDSVLRLDPEAAAFRTTLVDTMDYQMAINSIQALAKARALGGSADNLEKLMEADGPIVRDISRNVERGLARAGNQTKYIILQYYTSQRVMQYVGSNGITQETFDYDPNSLVPSHLPDEMIQMKKSRRRNKDTDEMEEYYEPGMPAEPSMYSKGQRARAFADNLRFFILPHSAHEITQMSYKLGLIQLRKAGIQIDSQTIAEAWDFDLGANFEGTSPYERFFEEQEDMAEHAIRLKMIVDSLQQQGIQPTPQMLAALASVTGPTREGRPPTGTKAPQLVSKDGGARTTISQSGS